MVISVNMCSWMSLSPQTVAVEKGITAFHLGLAYRDWLWGGRCKRKNASVLEKGLEGSEAMPVHTGTLLPCYYLQQNSPLQWWTCSIIFWIKKLGGGTTNNCEGCQEGRTNVFKHMGWDSSHLTNHVKIRCMLILALSVVHAEASFFQKVICPIPKGWPWRMGSVVLLRFYRPVDNREYRQILD